MLLDRVINSSLDMHDDTFNEPFKACDTRQQATVPVDRITLLYEFLVTLENLIGKENKESPYLAVRFPFALRCRKRGAYIKLLTLFLIVLATT